MRCDEGHNCENTRELHTEKLSLTYVLQSATILSSPVLWIVQLFNCEYIVGETKLASERVGRQAGK